MSSQPSKITFELPAWLNRFAKGYRPTNDIRERMKFIISAAGRNVAEQTGGPFAAAIYESGSGALVSLGVNLVMTRNLSILHAEIVAIALAERKIGTYDLGGPTLPGYELMATTEPCAMCLGAIIWSGVRRVVTAATDQDVRGIGFDEGPKPDNWVRALTDRGIEVVPHIERESAREVLRHYIRSGGVVYNSWRGGEGGEAPKES